MKKIVATLLNTKTNVFVTLIMVVVSSVTTLLFAVNLGFIVPLSTSDPLAGSLALIASSNPGSPVLDCDAGVYSPVQNKCVSRAVFDAEMQRLFTALGLDGTLYQQSETTNQ